MNRERRVIASIIKLLTKQNNSNTIHNVFFFFLNRRRVGAWGIALLNLAAN